VDVLPVRLAGAGDARSIARVQVLAWRATYRGVVPDEYIDAVRADDRDAAWDAWFADATAKRSAVLVVEDTNAGVVGFVAGGPIRAPAGPCDAEVYALNLLPPFQRRGLGRRLVVALARELVARGHRAMTVWALAENRARSFYEALGARCLAEDVLVLGGVEYPEVCYAWTDLGALLS
jgi:GNAT superfamily N-acetyltransferase